MSLGAIYEKIFVWHVGFWGEKTYGWHYDVMFLVMNLLIVFSNAGAYVIDEIRTRRNVDAIRSSRLYVLSRFLIIPQREVPSTVDAGDQQEYRRARDGIGCERSFCKQSNRTDDQARTTECQDAYVRKPVATIVQSQPDFVPHDDYLNLMGKSRESAQTENDHDWQCRWPSCQHSQGEE